MSIQDNIVKAMPPLSHLECKTCREVKSIGDMSHYLSSGWPTHCSQTMHLVTTKELESRS